MHCIDESVNLDDERSMSPQFCPTHHDQSINKDDLLAAYYSNYNFCFLLDPLDVVRR